MNEINQNSIGISEIKRGYHLLSSDYLIFDCTDSDGTVKTVRMRYDRLKRYLASRILENLKFGSMSTQKKEDYSNFAHGHEYTYFDFFSQFGPDAKRTDITPEQCYCIGQFSIRNGLPGYEMDCRQVDVYIPTPDGSTSNFNFSNINDLLYNVGDIQMFLIDNFQYYLTNYRNYQLTDYSGKTNVNIDLDGFDGFVIPNGTTYYCQPSQFKKACEMFSRDRNPEATSFTVPDLTGVRLPIGIGGQTNHSSDTITLIPSLLYIGVK